MSLMCAYKLCRVEFRYWGMQTKLEKFIHDTGKMYSVKLCWFLSTLCDQLLLCVFFLCRLRLKMKNIYSAPEFLYLSFWTQTLSWVLLFKINWFCSRAIWDRWLRLDTCDERNAFEIIYKNLARVICIAPKLNRAPYFTFQHQILNLQHTKII